jgi:transposase
LSTKIHALVDALGNPLAFLLTKGQQNREKLPRRNSIGRGGHFT